MLAEEGGGTVAAHLLAPGVEGPDLGVGQGLLLQALAEGENDGGAGGVVVRSSGVRGGVRLDGHQQNQYEDGCGGHGDEVEQVALDDGADEVEGGEGGHAGKAQRHERAEDLEAGWRPEDKGRAVGVQVADEHHALLGGIRRLDGGPDVLAGALRQEPAQGVGSEVQFEVGGGQSDGGD